IRHPLVAPQLPTKPGGLVPSRPSIGGVPGGGISSSGVASSPSSVGATGSIGIPGQMISSMATKVVQPTATVSSVPVSAPTTGIARSVSPGQLIRQTAISQLSVTSPPIVGGAGTTGLGTGGIVPNASGIPAGTAPDTYANTPTGKVSVTRHTEFIQLSSKIVSLIIFITQFACIEYDVFLVFLFVRLFCFFTFAITFITNLKGVGR
uniref:Uncharacterized protein n=1 Tax=Anopheles maculatus TaxID=74869 RepID=A0A182T1K7_9DIPT